MLRYVAENARYPNAGEPAEAENRPAQPASPSASSEGALPEFKSRYYKSWKEYREEHPALDPVLEPIMAPKLQSYEELLFKMISRLM